ncbi:LysR substrate-binding domain-containing protein [Nonomuraea sp. NPDC050556]|uniref:LysR substrate-binding domain-containing protein n=1 Tax=Nonomuraea sp. NPDC050556 TaxID=3364369 RepID=UPI0037BB16AB
MQLELRHLRVLRTVADHGSVTRAAAALGVSQPALTAQVRRIEHLLGGEVFARGHRGVVPTPYGEFVLARTRSIIAGVDDLLQARPSGTAGPVVGVGSFENPVVVALVDALTRAMPEARVTLQTEHFVRVLVDMVVNGRLDMALVADYPGHALRVPPSIGLAVVAQEPVFVAVSSAHRLAAASPVELADLADEQWVLPPSDGMGWPEHLLERCEQAGFAPRARYQLVEAGVRRELIGAGHAVSACQALYDPGDQVTVLPLRGDPLWMRHVLIWRTASPVDAHAQAMAEVAVSAHRTLAARNRAFSAWSAQAGSSANMMG